jgi:hypothetical protein
MKPMCDEKVLIAPVASHHTRTLASALSDFLVISPVSYVDFRPRGVRISVRKLTSRKRDIEIRDSIYCMYVHVWLDGESSGQQSVATHMPGSTKRSGTNLPTPFQILTSGWNFLFRSHERLDPGKGEGDSPRRLLLHPCFLDRGDRDWLPKWSFGNMSRRSEICRSGMLSHSSGALSEGCAVQDNPALVLTRPPPVYGLDPALARAHW